MKQGGRIVFAKDGSIFMTVGDRDGNRKPDYDLQLAQKTDVDVGKIIHLTADGLPAPNNPFLDKPGVRRTAEDAMLSINSIHCKFANGGVGYLISQRGDAMFGYGGWWSYEHCGAKSTFAIENCVEKLHVWDPKELDPTRGTMNQATPAPSN
jgi:hypothetical protein